MVSPGCIGADLNYTYRGLWGTLVSMVVLFLVSSLTKAPVTSDIQRLTVDWKAPVQPIPRIV